jgi:hypothetical protein
MQALIVIARHSRFSVVPEFRCAVPGVARIDRESSARRWTESMRNASMAVRVWVIIDIGRPNEDVTIFRDCGLETSVRLSNYGNWRYGSRPCFGRPLSRYFILMSGHFFCACRIYILPFYILLYITNLLLEINRVLFFIR